MMYFLVHAIDIVRNDLSFTKRKLYAAHSIFTVKMLASIGTGA